MEGRDLSFAAANRDAYSVIDGDNTVFIATIVLAKDAALHF